MVRVRQRTAGVLVGGYTVVLVKPNAGAATTELAERGSGLWTAERGAKPARPSPAPHRLGQHGDHNR